MQEFKKRISIKSIPATAKKFENGDVCIKRDEYVKGEPMFGYYRPTTKGFVLEKLIWKGIHAARYNWAKQQPGFDPKRKKAA